MSLRLLPRISLYALTSVVVSSTVAFCQEGKKDPHDPFSCFNPSCADKMKLFADLKKQVHHQKEEAPSSSGEKSALPTPVPSQEEVDCPIDRSECGNYAWNLLHTVAANYPDEPTEEDQQQAKNFIYGLAWLYPCTICGRDFRMNIELKPPRVESRKAFVLWLCEQHNIVNEKLNKPIFPCDLTRLDLRWRTGGPGCWDNKLSIAQERQELAEAEAAEAAEAASQSP